MAATADDEGASKEIESSKEPSNLELRKMLIDIQIMVNKILSENKNISNNISELKASVQKQQAELATLKDSVAKATKELAVTEKDLPAAINKIDEQQKEVAELYNQQDHLEQYTWKNSLEIHSIPKKAYTSTKEAVLKLAEVLEVLVAP